MIRLRRDPAKVVQNRDISDRHELVTAFEIFGHGSKSTPSHPFAKAAKSGDPLNLGGSESMDGPRTLPELESV